ncbi:hypothetical protein IFO70_25620 [Phormidium tenue FACHB-886]|nr:hypothetical protein [Phormidium tenue FACHB-886]
MPTPDRYKDQRLKRLQQFIALIPVLGFFPALWMLYRGTGDPDQRNTSRLAVILATGWIFGYILLGAGAQLFDSASLQLLILASLLTSGYFITNLWLIVRLWLNQSVRLPGFSRLSDRLP